MKKKVVIGDCFDSIEATVQEINPVPAEVVQAETVRYEAKVRSRIAYVILAVMMMFIMGAAVIGIADEEFSKLQAVWSVLGPAAAGIIGYYFKDP